MKMKNTMMKKKSLKKNSLFGVLVLVKLSYAQAATWKDKRISQDAGGKTLVMFAGQSKEGFKFEMFHNTQVTDEDNYFQCTKEQVVVDIRESSAVHEVSFTHRYFYKKGGETVGES